MELICAMHSATPIIFVLLVAFALYRRVRRTVGFQKFVRSRLVTRMVLFGVVGVLILAAAVVYPTVYVYDAIGALIGAGIAYYAIRTTAFERRSGEWYYRPHPWIGVILIVLFVGRLAFQVYQDSALISSAASGQAANQAQLSAYAHEPITAGIFFILIAYYIVYFAFLIRKEKHLEVQPATEADERPY
ncbi:CcdC protein domain-containing protein [Alicyclobacillus sp. ALC3]|uniref:CcdC protein domain-containing protein n=1 Tax=Alicyclobacillus sp. ALC3 TaxID=2796143 RepID=UPI002379425F|nr:CcdC protein domain-containing protein [Alicyclobacillus sp. ALC3]WDL95724.1 hypothetical protein JC200_15295 [Alicyclobacillus sp. ALC3]